MTDVQGGVDRLEKEWVRILEDSICAAFKKNINNKDEIKNIFLNTSTALLGGDPTEIITQIQTENVMEKFNVDKQPTIAKAIQHSIVKTAKEIIKQHEHSMLEFASHYVEKSIGQYFDHIKSQIKQLNSEIKDADVKTKKNLQFELAKKQRILQKRDFTEVYEEFKKMSTSPIEGTDLKTILKVLEIRGSKKMK